MHKIISGKAQTSSHSSKKIIAAAPNLLADLDKPVLRAKDLDEAAKMKAIKLKANLAKYKKIVLDDVKGNIPALRIVYILDAFIEATHIESISLSRLSITSKDLSDNLIEIISKNHIRILNITDSIFGQFEAASADAATFEDSLFEKISSSTTINILNLAGTNFNSEKLAVALSTNKSISKVILNASDVTSDLITKITRKIAIEIKEGITPEIEFTLAPIQKLNPHFVEFANSDFLSFIGQIERSEDKTCTIGSLGEHSNAHLVSLREYFLNKHITSQTTLNSLNHDQLSSQTGAYSFDDLVASILSGRPIKSLNLGRIHDLYNGDLINQPKFTALMKALVGFPHLEELIFTNDRLTQGNSKLLFTVIERASNLKKINLNKLNVHPALETDFGALMAAKLSAIPKSESAINLAGSNMGSSFLANIPSQSSIGSIKVDDIDDAFVESLSTGENLVIKHLDIASNNGKMKFLKAAGYYPEILDRVALSIKNLPVTNIVGLFISAGNNQKWLKNYILALKATGFLPQGLIEIAKSVSVSIGFTQAEVILQNVDAENAKEVMPALLEKFTLAQFITFAPKLREKFEGADISYHLTSSMKEELKSSTVSLLVKAKSEEDFDECTQYIYFLKRVMPKDTTVVPKVVAGISDLNNLHQFLKIIATKEYELPISARAVEAIYEKSTNPETWQLVKGIVDWKSVLPAVRGVAPTSISLLIGEEVAGALLPVSASAYNVAQDEKPLQVTKAAPIAAHKNSIPPTIITPASLIKQGAVVKTSSKFALQKYYNESLREVLQKETQEILQEGSQERLNSLLMILGNSDYNKGIIHDHLEQILLSCKDLAGLVHFLTSSQQQGLRGIVDSIKAWLHVEKILEENKEKLSATKGLLLVLLKNAEDTFITSKLLDFYKNANPNIRIAQQEIVEIYTTPPSLQSNSIAFGNITQMLCKIFSNVDLLNLAKVAVRTSGMSAVSVINIYSEKLTPAILAELVPATYNRHQLAEVMLIAKNVANITFTTSINGSIRTIYDVVPEGLKTFHDRYWKRDNEIFDAKNLQHLEQYMYLLQRAGVTFSSVDIEYMARHYSGLDDCSGHCKAPKKLVAFLKAMNALGIKIKFDQELLQKIFEERKVYFGDILSALAVFPIEDVDWNFAIMTAREQDSRFSLASCVNSDVKGFLERLLTKAERIEEVDKLAEEIKLTGVELKTKIVYTNEVLVSFAQQISKGSSLEGLKAIGFDLATKVGMPSDNSVVNFCEAVLNRCESLTEIQNFCKKVMGANIFISYTQLDKIIEEYSVSILEYIGPAFSIDWAHQIKTRALDPLKVSNWISATQLQTYLTGFIEEAESLERITALVQRAQRSDADLVKMTPVVKYSIALQILSMRRNEKKAALKALDAISFDFNKYFNGQSFRIAVISSCEDCDEAINLLEVFWGDTSTRDQKQIIKIIADLSERQGPYRPLTKRILDYFSGIENTDWVELYNALRKTNHTIDSLDFAQRIDRIQDNSFLGTLIQGASPDNLSDLITKLKQKFKLTLNTKIGEDEKLVLSFIPIQFASLSAISDFIQQNFPGEEIDWRQKNKKGDTILSDMASKFGLSLQEWFDVGISMDDILDSDGNNLLLLLLINDVVGVLRSLIEIRKKDPEFNINHQNKNGDRLIDKAVLLLDHDAVLLLDRIDSINSLRSMGSAEPQNPIIGDTILLRDEDVDTDHNFKVLIILSKILHGSSQLSEAQIDEEIKDLRDEMRKQVEIAYLADIANAKQKIYNRIGDSPENQVFKEHVDLLLQNLKLILANKFLLKKALVDLSLGLPEQIKNALDQYIEGAIPTSKIQTQLYGYFDPSSERASAIANILMLEARIAEAERKLPNNLFLGYFTEYTKEIIGIFKFQGKCLYGNMHVNNGGFLYQLDYLLRQSCEIKSVEFSFRKEIAYLWVCAKKNSAEIEFISGFPVLDNCFPGRMINLYRLVQTHITHFVRDKSADFKVDQSELQRAAHSKLKEKFHILDNEKFNDMIVQIFINFNENILNPTNWSHATCVFVGACNDYFIAKIYERGSKGIIPSAHFTNFLNNIIAGITAEPDTSEGILVNSYKEGLNFIAYQLIEEINNNPEDVTQIIERYKTKYGEALNLSYLGPRRCFDKLESGDKEQVLYALYLSGLDLSEGLEDEINEEFGPIKKSDFIIAMSEVERNNDFSKLEVFKQKWKMLGRDAYQEYVSKCIEVHKDDNNIIHKLLTVINESGLRDGRRLTNDRIIANKKAAQVKLLEEMEQEPDLASKALGIFLEVYKTLDCALFTINETQRLLEVKNADLLDVITHDNTEILIDWVRRQDNEHPTILHFLADLEGVAQQFAVEIYLSHEEWRGRAFDLLGFNVDGA